MASLIRFADCAAVPWKNGTGTTRELWKQVDEAGVAARISAATISGQQDFSRFEGFDRVILQLAGPQVVLTIEGREIAMLPSAPLAFRGEAAVSSAVAGAALDLNLMARRSRFQPVMAVMAAAAGQEVSAAPPLALRAVLALEAASVSGAVAGKLCLHDLVVLQPGEALRLESAARLVVMDLRPAGPR